ncbi:MAG: hypothetical protein KKF88_14065 [Alphaproteobacteria bacterium]|nr:hypothetical protein [Alphaproteobacteria bacterium]
MILHRIVGIAIAGMLVSACSQPNDWTLFVYPAGQGSHAIITPGFTRDMCAFAGREAVASHTFAAGRWQQIAKGKSGKPTFECGRRCRVHEGQTVSICAETFDAGD